MSTAAPTTPGYYFITWPGDGHERKFVCRLFWNNYPQGIKFEVQSVEYPQVKLPWWVGRGEPHWGEFLGANISEAAKTLHPYEVALIEGKTT